MNVLVGSERNYYIEKYNIQSFFSFPITSYIQVHQFKRGEFIFKEGTSPNYLYYLVEGKAKIYITHENGKVSLLNFIEAPAFIGELELLNAEHYTKGIQTSTDVVCLAIPIHSYKEQLLEDVTFLRHLAIFLSQKATVLSAKSAQNQAYPLENRLASFILLSAEHDVYKEKHTEVCEYLGVSYRHLLHVLAQFCHDQILTKQHRSYIIRDKERLKQLAKMN